MATVNPLVTIIIPTYNHEKYVQQSILSAINQTYENIEIIIIDDGSIDSTPEIISKVIGDYSQAKQILFIKQANHGLTKTLNKAAMLSSGDYITFLASDDAYLPERIEVGLKALLDTDDTYAATYSDGYIINESGKKISIFSNKYLVPLSSNVRKELLLGNWIPALSVLYKRKVLFECGLFDENIEVEDYDLLMRVSRKYKFKYISKKLFLYRKHGNNYSDDQEKMEIQFDKIAQKYDELRRYRLFRTALSKKDPIAFQYLSLLNLELLFRRQIRKLQSTFTLMNLSYFQFFLALNKMTIRYIDGRLTALLLRAKGLDIGSGSKCYGKLSIIGNHKNVKIGKSVRFLGTSRFITENSHGRESVSLGDNTTLDFNVTIHCHGGNIIIGKNCFIGPNVHIQGGGDISIGDNTMIAANSFLFASNHITEVTDQPYNRQGEVFIGINIGANCWLGTSVVVLDGAVLGENCVVGANCVLKGNYTKNSHIVAKSILGKTIEQ